MGKEHEAEDRATGQIDALLVVVRAIIGGLSPGDTEGFSARYEANLQQLRDQMIASEAEDSYFDGLDSAAAYVRSAIRRTPLSSS